MDYRPLGTSGLQISALTLGTMTFGGGGSFRKVGDTALACNAIVHADSVPHRHAW